MNLIEAMKLMLDGGYCYSNTFGCVRYRNGSNGEGFYNLTNYMIPLRTLLDCKDTWVPGPANETI